MVSFRSKITRAVLSYFFLHQNEERYPSDLSRRLSLDSGNLSRKLIELEDEGILKSRWLGEQRFYSLNKDFPLYDEYRAIVLKTLGLEARLKKALKNIPGISRAVIFGSYARNQMSSSSDIDLLVVGDQDTIEVQKMIARIQKDTDREINVYSLSEKEYNKKKSGDSFLNNIKKEKTIRLF